MYRMNRSGTTATGLRRRAAWAALAATLALSAGCGDDSAEPLEAPADEPAAQEEAVVPTQDPDPDPCELPQDLVAEQPWVRNIPC